MIRTGPTQDETALDECIDRQATNGDWIVALAHVLVERGICTREAFRDILVTVIERRLRP